MTRLYPADRLLLERMLLARRAENLVPLGVLAQAGLSPDADLQWEGAFEQRGGRTLRAALLRMGRMEEGWAAAVPAGDVDACRVLGERARGSTCRFMLAPRAQGDAFWEGLGAPLARLWSDHRLFLCERIVDGPRLALRRARRGELEAVARIALEMEREDLGVDLLGDDPETHRADVARKISEGRVLVGELDGALVFKGDIGITSGRGALVGGLWVRPALRGRGLGQAGVRAMTAELLRNAPLVGLHVRDDNAPAIGAYRRVGFVADAAFRLVVSEP